MALFYLILANLVLATLSTTPPALSLLDQLRYDIMLKIDQIDLWEPTNELEPDSHVVLDDTKLMDIFRDISLNLSNVTIQGLGSLEWELEYAQLVTEVNNIDEYFQTFRRLQQQPVKWRHELAWTDMANYILERSDKGINATLDKIHNFYHLFQKIPKDSKSSICEMQQSQQQLIYNLYTMITLAELKGYTMLQFAWMLLKIYDKGNFKQEADLLKNLYTERTLQKMNAAKEAMSGADRSIYRCDPRTWIENETYIRLTKLLQGYIENEVNLNSEGTCGQNCAYYTATRYHGCFKQQFCSKQPPCRGEIIKCTYYDSDMNICQSTETDRRYDWIEYENRKILGRKNSCPARNLHKVDSWWRYLFWHCSYCFCLCDDNSPTSDRFFSLRIATANVTANKVITGVRFVKDNQVIHIQIQQGLLGPRGIINKTQTEWVPIQSFKTMDNDAINGVDYFTMSHTQRAIDLDDAIAPATHVPTGVRFRKVGPHLNIEMKATPFDYATGQLGSDSESIWIGNDNTAARFNDPRKEILLNDPDVPTRKGPHITLSHHDEFIQFRESSLRDDASQSTVPYLDAQPLETSGQILAGLGLHHRGAIHSGGFLSLKLITYDYSAHMIPEVPVA